MPDLSSLSIGRAGPKLLLLREQVPKSYLPVVLEYLNKNRMHFQVLLLPSLLVMVFFGAHLLHTCVSRSTPTPPSI